jgi:nucleotide-binding universal stress UspA family protein
VGIARDIIIEAKKGYDAVVMGRRGMSPVKDLLFGSTANKLVSRLLDVPVWVIGGSPSTDKLLVAVDRSEGAQRALNYVERFLTRDGTCCECLLFHVLRGSHTFVRDDGGLMVPKGEEDWQERAKLELEKAEEEMKTFFNETIQQWSRNGIDTSRVSSMISWGESRAGNIVDQAARAGYGTIVVGRRGMSKVEEFFMGRVSNKVLQLAKEMAVWVVH